MPELLYSSNSSTNTHLINQIISVAKVEIGEQLRNALARVRSDVLGDIKYIVRNSIKSSPEYLELAGGFHSGSYHQFGIPDIRERMDRIIEEVVNDVGFDVNIFESSTGQDFVFEMKVEILKLDYSKLLGNSDGVFTTDKGEVLEWLRWLLLEGDRPIILNYHYIPKISRSSRTGFGLMVPRREWFVPQHLTGSGTDNWLTRALSPLEQQLPGIIEKIFKYF